MNIVKGKVYKDKYTKHLTQRIGKNDIAVIKHCGLDLVAAQELKFRGVGTIINCEKSINDIVGIDGILYLIKSGIRIYDICDSNFFELVQENDSLLIIDNEVFVNNIFYAYCMPVLEDDVLFNAEYKKYIYDGQKYSFIKNTVQFMISELEYFIEGRDLPELGVDIEGREVVIVCRGRGYRDDLKSIRKFILRKKPVLISVDGGADAVFELGLESDIIVGDMDSVSDRCLLNCPVVLIHTYSNGYAPGLKRIKSIGIKYQLLNIKGTSEDAAIYMAKQKGASKIYLVGSHTGFKEFVEKGRHGMGSTALLRILFGSDIVDLKGINSVIEATQMNYLKFSIILILISAACYMMISNSYIFEYMKFSLKALFNIY